MNYNKRLNYSSKNYKAGLIALHAVTVKYPVKENEALTYELILRLGLTSKNSLEQAADLMDAAPFGADQDCPDGLEQALDRWIRSRGITGQKLTRELSEFVCFWAAKYLLDNNLFGAEMLEWNRTHFRKT